MAGKQPPPPADSAGLDAEAHKALAEQARALVNEIMAHLIKNPDDASEFADTLPKLQKEISYHTRMYEQKLAQTATSLVRAAFAPPPASRPHRTRRPTVRTPRRPQGRTPRSTRRGSSARRTTVAARGTPSDSDEPAPPLRRLLAFPVALFAWAIGLHGLERDLRDLNDDLRALIRGWSR